MVDERCMLPFTFCHHPEPRIFFVKNMSKIIFYSENLQLVGMNRKIFYRNVL